jgi:hypothetical protein
MVILPHGWSSPVGTGDAALTLTGPDGMCGAVTIAATALEPGGAFLKYAVDMRDSRRGVKFTVAAAQFCGYTRQQLTGTFPGPSGTFDFAERVTTSGPTRKSTWSRSNCRGRRARPDSMPRDPR